MLGVLENMLNSKTTISKTDAVEGKINKNSSFNKTAKISVGTKNDK